MNVKMINRVLCYLLGLLILAFGVVVSLNAGLGISPVSSPPRAMHLALEAHGITSISLGTCVTLIYCLYVVIQIIILRREFKLINLLQLVVSTVFGWFVDFARYVMGGWRIPTYAGSLVMLAISILLIAIGISMYLGAKLLPMPSEGMGLAITAKLKKYPYHRVKIVIDCVFVLSAILIMIIFTGHFGVPMPDGSTSYVVREGTVITALCVGPVMGILGKWLNPLIRTICFAPQNGDGPAEAAKPTDTAT